jgi:hypothetical protein
MAITEAKARPIALSVDVRTGSIPRVYGERFPTTPESSASPVWSGTR